MKPEDISKQLHERLMDVSDDIFKMFQESPVTEKVAFLALCMSLARMTLVMGKDPEIANTFVVAYRRACNRSEERKANEKNQLN